MSNGLARLYDMAILVESYRQMKLDKRYGILGFNESERLIELDETFYKKFNIYSKGFDRYGNEIRYIDRTFHDHDKEDKVYRFYTLLNKDGTFIRLKGEEHDKSRS